MKRSDIENLAAFLMGRLDAENAQWLRDYEREYAIAESSRRRHGQESQPRAIEDSLRHMGLRYISDPEYRPEWLPKEARPGMTDLLRPGLTKDDRSWLLQQWELCRP